MAEIIAPSHEVDFGGKGSNKAWVFLRFIVTQVGEGPFSNFYHQVCAKCPLLDASGMVSCTGAGKYISIDEAKGELSALKAISVRELDKNLEPALCAMRQGLARSVSLQTLAQVFRL